MGPSCYHCATCSELSTSGLPPCRSLIGSCLVQVLCAIMLLLCIARLMWASWKRNRESQLLISTQELPLKFAAI